MALTAKYRIFRWGVVSALFLVTGCSYQVLEAKDVLSFQIQPVATSPLKIHLSGIVGHSALGIWGTATQQEGQALQVSAFLTLANEKTSGRLDYTFTVPDSVNTVTFGKEKTVVWTRQ